MTTADLRKLLDRGTVSLEDAARALGVSRTTAYAQAGSDIPVIKIGRRIRVPAAELRRLLCIEAEAA